RAVAAAVMRDDRSARDGRCGTSDERKPPAARPHGVAHPCPHQPPGAAPADDRARDTPRNDIGGIPDGCLALVHDHARTVLHGIGRNTSLRGLIAAPKRATTGYMNENDITAREPSVDERFMGDWVAFGMSELQAYLT